MNMQEFWDQRFDIKEFVYGRHPNAFFKDFIDHHKAGSLLLPAEGEGRNAVYAALKGKMDGPSGDLHALALTTKAPD